MRRLHETIDAIRSGLRGPLTENELAAFARELKSEGRVDLAIDTTGDNTRIIIRMNRPTQSAGLLARLSKREREVALLVARGLTNGEIADRLSLSVATVKDHVHHILARLEMKSRVAVARALADVGDDSQSPSEDS